FLHDNQSRDIRYSRKLSDIDCAIRSRRSRSCRDSRDAVILRRSLAMLRPACPEAPRKASGADLRFATLSPQFASCERPVILTFAKAALRMGSECWNRTTRWHRDRA